MRKSLRRIAPLAAATVAVAGLSAGAAQAGSGSGSSGAGDVAIQNEGLDLANETVTLPLHRGTSRGQTVYYVITDSSDKDDAKARGVAAAPKLRNALGTKAVQTVTRKPTGYDFPGGVDFSPTRVVVPGPDGFPPEQVVPGARGDAQYSPLITTGDGVVLNATQIANDSGLHDAVVSIDKARNRVTLKTFFGFWHGHRTVYLHQDASSELVAAIEGSTYAPNLDASPGVGSNADDSARSAIIPVINGERGVGNPSRQGLESALLGEGDPLNINQEVPGKGNRYSPVWDVTPIQWSDAAITAGKRRLLTSESDVAGEAKAGRISGIGTIPNASLGGVKAPGFISNCPVITTL